MRDYCASQTERANKRSLELQSRIRQNLQDGSFVFRGQTTAVSAFDTALLEAAKKQLGEVAERVFERYAEAPVRVQTDTAERMLKIGNPSGINSTLDPLGLVQTQAGRGSFRSDHKAMVSIRDYIDHRGTVDGKRLLDDFNSQPFGWSPDTTRYILAAMLMAGEIKLKVSGREVTAAGQQAIDALKSNVSFKSIGVALRNERPSNDTLARAAERLSTLIGDTIIPLEQEISKATAKHFPRFQNDYGALSEKLRGLGLGGSDRIRTMNTDIADILFTDASDAPHRLGAEQSAVYDNLRWASEIKRVFDNGLDETLSDLQTHRRDIEGLPDTGVPGELRKGLADDLDGLAQRLKLEDFYGHVADFNSLLTHIKARVRDAAKSLSQQQGQRIRDGVEDLQRLPEWADLTQEDRSNAVARLESLELQVEPDLDGLRKLLARNFDIGTTIEEQKQSIIREVAARRAAAQPPAALGVSESRKRQSVRLPSKLTTAMDLDAVIDKLEGYRDALNAGDTDVELNIGSST